MQSTLIRDNNSIISALRRLLIAELQISLSGIIPEFQNSRFERVSHSRFPEFQIALWSYSKVPDLRGLTIPEFQIAQSGIIPDSKIWNSGVLDELGLANLEFWNYYYIYIYIYTYTHIYIYVYVYVYVCVHIYIYKFDGDRTQFSRTCLMVRARK